MMEIEKLISEDKTSGSTELMKKATKFFISATKKKLDIDTFSKIGKKIIRAQPMMASIINFLNYLFLELEKKQKKVDLEIFLNRYLTKSNIALKKIGNECFSLIEDNATIMTYSYSSTVFSALKDCKRKKIKVILSEARPNLEGRALASKLCNIGIKTTFVLDSALPSYMEKCDFVFIGGDAITEKELINKVGTKTLSICAKDANIPIYSIADESKFISRKFINYYVYHDEKEVWNINKKNLTIKNFYYDATPLKNLDGIITENGIKLYDDVRRIIDRKRISKWLTQNIPGIL
ncbi:MAG: hypothetical protein AB1779_07135 [Candidatus Thermoplasmatota archaeon]